MALAAAEGTQPQRDHVTLDLALGSSSLRDSCVIKDSLKCRFVFLNNEGAAERPTAGSRSVLKGHLLSDDLSDYPLLPRHCPGAAASPLPATQICRTENPAKDSVGLKDWIWAPLLCFFLFHWLFESFVNE